MASRLVRVLTVNQNRVLRDGIRMLIGLEPDIELVAAADTPNEAPGLFTEKRPEVTVLDVDFPEQAGLTAIRRILEIDPAARIIALVNHDWDGIGPRAVDAGAAAFLSKDLIGESLVPLIRAGRAASA